MYHSRTRSRPIIAVVGSAGKTTTKEMIASILQKRYKIFKTLGNLNLPTYIYRQRRKITPYHRALVLEYGMSKPGHISQNCRIIRPNIGIITMVGTAHIGNFGGSLSRLAYAKSELIRGMKPTGLLFLNADDWNSKLLSTRSFRGRICKIGIHNNAQYRASGILYGSWGTSFTVILNKRKERFTIPALGKHNVYNALFAIAVCHRLGVSASLIRRGLLTYQKPSRRLVVYRQKYKVKLLDDTFSANPQATKAALDVLKRTGTGKKVAILGDMLELGSYSRRGHRLVGAYAAKKNLHRLLTYGRLANHIRTASIQAGLPSFRTRHFLSRGALHSFLNNTIAYNSTILVKGSHKMNMHRTIHYLRKIT